MAAALRSAAGGVQLGAPRRRRPAPHRARREHGDLGIPGRQAFRTPERFALSNTYVVAEGSLALRNHLGVRDVLRGDDAIREEYATVKRRAAAEALDIDDYFVRKTAVLDRVLRAAGLTDSERASIADATAGITGRGAHG